MAEVVHACPPEGAGVMPCCGRMPFEVPQTDRMTAVPEFVTCTPKPAPAEVPAECEFCGGVPRRGEVPAEEFGPGLAHCSGCGVILHCDGTDKEHASAARQRITALEAALQQAKGEAASFKLAAEAEADARIESVAEIEKALAEALACHDCKEYREMMSAKLAEAQDQITAYEGAPDWKRLYREAEAKLAEAIKDSDETTAIMAEANAGILKHLRTAEAENEGLQATSDHYRVSYINAEAKYELLRSAVNENSGACSEACDKTGHGEGCLYIDMASTLETLQAQVRELRAALEDLTWDQDGEVNCWPNQKRVAALLAWTDPTSVQSGAGE